MFTHANILTRRFGACSVSVKIALFRSYCICFYGMELWKSYSMSAINRLRSCYVKCMKLFFNCPKYHSVTNMLFELELPSFDTLIWNSKARFKRKVKNCCNGIISQLNLVLWCRLIRILPFCVFFLFFLLLTVYICLCVCECFLCNFVLFVFAMGRVA